MTSLGSLVSVVVLCLSAQSSLADLVLSPTTPRVVVATVRPFSDRIDLVQLRITDSATEVRVSERDPSKVLQVWALKADGSVLGPGASLQSPVLTPEGWVFRFEKVYSLRDVVGVTVSVNGNIVARAVHSD